MRTVLFTIEVSGEYRSMGQGNSEIYVAQAIAPNGEKLHYRAEALAISIALEELAKQMHRHDKLAGTLVRDLPHLT
jgi:hypothetical protein